MSSAQHDQVMKCIVVLPQYGSPLWLQKEEQDQLIQ